jgi:hypothetical protein
MKTLLVTTLACAALAGACKKTTTTTTGEPAAKATDGNAALVAVTPGKLELPPLGAPDAIEPPTRDILPGSTVAEARTKGAKGDGSLALEWKPNIELSHDEKTGLVSDLQVTYPKAEFEALKARWGKPFTEDVWMGANWVASLNGCASGDSCTVTFTRSPAALIGPRIAPPLSLANLKAGMTPAQVASTVGVPLEDMHTAAIGYAFTVGVDYDDDTLAAIELDTGIGEYDDWMPMLTKAWGPPAELDGHKVWINAKDGWLVQHDAYGDMLRFIPITPVAEIIAKDGPHSALAIAKAALGKPQKGLTLPHYDAKEDEFSFLGTELAFQAPDIVMDTDDKEQVNEVRLFLYDEHEDGGKNLEKLVTAAWGPITTSKDENDEELRVIKVDGLTAIIETDSNSLTAKFRK